MTKSRKNKRQQPKKEAKPGKKTDQLPKEEEEEDEWILICFDDLL